MMATSKKAVKSKPKAKKATKPAVKKKAAKPAVKKQAVKKAVKKVVKKKVSRPVVKKKAAKPATKKKSTASSAASARVKALQANINALRKQILGLKNDVRVANKRAEAIGGLSAKRSAAVAKFVSGWDRKATAAASRSARPKKKK